MTAWDSYADRHGVCLMSLRDGKTYIDQADDFIGISDEVLDHIRRGYGIGELGEGVVLFHADNGDVAYRLVSHHGDYWDAELLSDDRVLTVLP